MTSSARMRLTEDWNSAPLSGPDALALIRNGLPLDCDADAYTQRLRPTLSEFAEACLESGDLATALTVLVEMVSLDIRFGVAEEEMDGAS